MKDIFKITISLTGVCIAAAIILGIVFTQTEAARKHIEEKRKEETIQGLLGYGGGKKAPADLKVTGVHRYVLTDSKAGTQLGYVLPTEGGKFVMVRVDLSGKPLKTIPIAASPQEMADEGARNVAVKKAMPDGIKADYAETFYVAELGDKRLGYVLPGITQGFKTFVKMMVSLNPDFTVTGVAITESEEDPGLGAEIEQNYFRNQFVGKTLEMLKTLKVIKKPLPQDYVQVLEPARAAKLSSEKVKEIKEEHVKDDIYALTGATISSRAVTRGVKSTVKKFVYRFYILTKAVEQENVRVAF